MGLHLFLASLAVLLLAGVVALAASHMLRPTDGVGAIGVPGSLLLSLYRRWA